MKMAKKYTLIKYHQNISNEQTIQTENLNKIHMHICLLSLIKYHLIK